MLDLDSKGISQLLFSPLYLFSQILGILVPGAVLTLLCALKGNHLIRAVWLYAPFGYKTKVAIFLLVTYVVGSALRLPLIVFGLAAKKREITIPEQFKGQPPVVVKMIMAIVSDGVILATPGLMDRLSLIQANGAFHLATGIALMTASVIPGDGQLRLIEVLIGLAMVVAGFRKAHEYQDEVVRHVGIGLANVVGRMTPAQLTLTAALFKSLTNQSAATTTVEAMPAVESEVAATPGAQAETQ